MNEPDMLADYKTKVGEELRKDLEKGYWHGWRDENPLEHVLPVGYDGAITQDVHNVLRLLRDERALFYDKIAARLGVDKRYVHLILEVLADRDFTEYGTSPRGSWLTEKGEQLLALTDEWEAMPREQCSQCGAVIEGYHACQGVPGGF